MIYCRFCIVNQKRNVLSIIHPALLFASCLVISFILNIPEFFAFNISNEYDNIYKISYTNFAKQTLYKTYNISLNLLQNILVIIILIFLTFRTIQILNKEKLIVKRNKSLNSVHFQKKVLTTKLIITLIFFFIITHLNAIIGLVFQHNESLMILYNHSIINISYNLTYVMNLIITSLAPFVFLYYRMKMNRIVKKP